MGEGGIGEDDLWDIMGLKKEQKQLVELKSSHEKTFSYIEGERLWKHVTAVDTRYRARHKPSSCKMTRSNCFP